MQPQWFETFFRGIAVDFWIKAIPPEFTLADVDFLEKSLRLEPGARLLDVPCGNGRHALELTRRGYRLTGVDLSEEFLGHARRDSASAGLTIDWHHADMRSLPDLQPFDGAYCFGNSFGYLDKPSADQFLSSLAAMLRPGARFILETGAAAESILPSFRRNEWYRAGDMFILSERRYVPEHSRLDIDYTFVHNGSVETRPTSSYVRTSAELSSQLERAGFRVEALYGSVQGEPYQLASNHLIIVAGIPR